MFLMYWLTVLVRQPRIVSSRELGNEVIHNRDASDDCQAGIALKSKVKNATVSAMISNRRGSYKLKNFDMQQGTGCECLSVQLL